MTWFPLNSGELPKVDEEEVLIHGDFGFDIAKLRIGMNGRYWYGYKLQTLDFYSVNKWARLTA